jgi:predicted protein tyrosine phosphatase
MSATLTDCDIHKLVSRFNVEVQEEASVVLHYIWKDDPTKSSTLPGCISALTEDEELYRVLKVAHARGIYDVVRKWESSACSSPFIAHKHLTLSRNTIAAVIMPRFSSKGRR